MVIRIDLLIHVIPVVLWGMLGIFVVTGVIIGAVTLLNKYENR